MGFPLQRYWSELPFSSPEDLPNPGIELRSLTLEADSLPAESQGKLKNMELVAYSSPGDLTNPGSEPRSPTLQEDSLSFEPPGKPIMKFRSGLHKLSIICHLIYNPLSYVICQETHITVS